MEQLSDWNSIRDDELERVIVNRARAIGFDLQGPVETAYGWGWSPTLTFWYGSRRVHYYYDSIYNEGMIIEAASPSKVLRGVAPTPETIWQVIDKFLHQQCSFEDLPDCGWRSDGLDHDKFIPTDLTTPNPANIVDVVNYLEKHGQRWEPPQESGFFNTIWSKLRKSLRRTKENSRANK